VSDGFLKEWQRLSEPLVEDGSLTAAIREPFRDARLLLPLPALHLLDPFRDQDDCGPEGGDGVLKRRDQIVGMTPNVRERGPADAMVFARASENTPHVIGKAHGTTLSSAWTTVKRAAYSASASVRAWLSAWGRRARRQRSA
jgi:hypothetical protein